MENDEKRDTGGEEKEIRRSGDEQMSDDVEEKEAG